MLRRVALYLAVMVSLAALLVGISLLVFRPKENVTKEQEAGKNLSAIRRWTDSSGEFKIDAELVEVKDGRAYFKKSDGKRISVLTGDLCAADQQYLESLSAGQTAASPASNRPPESSVASPPENSAARPPENIGAKQSPLRFGQETIEQELTQPTKFEFKGMRLSEVLKSLAQQHRIVILIDEGDFSFGGEHPASILVDSAVANGESLEEALRTLLTKHGQRYSVRHGVLQIGSWRKSSLSCEMRIYRNHTKTKNKIDDLGRQIISRLVSKAKYGSDTWTAGEFFAVEMPDNLLAVQDSDVGHRLISRLFPGEFTYIGCTPEELLDSRKKVQSRPKEWAASEKIMEQLTSLDFENTPLRDATEYLSARLGIDVLIDQEALAKNSVPLDAPFTIQVQGIPLESALSLMVESHGLCVQPHDLGLMITTTMSAEDDGVELIYDIADLVGGNDGRGLGALIGKMSYRGRSLTRPQNKLPGVFSYDPARGTMGVRNSYWFHRDVEKILATMRAAKKQ